MKFDAIFIDVDGTLLTDKHTILPGTKKILKRLSDSGVLICIVTARSPSASFHFYEEMEIPGNPIICFNGALIQSNKDTVFENTISTSVASSLINVLKEFDISLSLYKHQDWFAEKPDEWLSQEMKITNTVFTEIKFSEVFSQNFEPNKLLGMGNPEQIKAAEQKLKNAGHPGLNIHKSKLTYLEIMNSQASKKSGVEKIIQWKNINSDNILTVGDNYNDLDMLRFSKTSMVMGNAPDDVKKIGTYVTDTNNNEGIEKGLKYLLQL